MTDAWTQFLILACLAGIGAGAGIALALTDFADKALGGRIILRFSAEFVVVSCSGILLWLVVLLLSDGVFRLFFVVPSLFFALICYTCIQKLLSPRLHGAKNAIERFKKTREGNFIVKYLLK